MRALNKVGRYFLLFGFYVFMIGLYNHVSATTLIITSPDGTTIDLDSVAHALTFSSTFIQNDTVQAVSQQTRVPTYYTQTYTNDGTYITHISQWIMGSPVSVKKGK